MSFICPTVTSENINQFNNQLKLVESFANRIHIDLMDGEFAPTKSPNLTDIKLQSKADLDIHVMFKNPAILQNELINIKPNMVIIHAESIADIPLFATNMRQAGIKTGLAILPETSVEFAQRLFPHVQHVLVFGGHLGYHGGKADLGQLDKIPQIQKLARHVEIGWDGGATQENVIQIKEAGVDVINVGSAIHKSEEPKTEYERLVSLVQ